MPYVCTCQTQENALRKPSIAKYKYMSFTSPNNTLCPKPDEDT